MFSFKNLSTPCFTTRPKIAVIIKIQISSRETTGTKDEQSEEQPCTYTEGYNFNFQEFPVLLLDRKCYNY